MPRNRWKRPKRNAKSVRLNILLCSDHIKKLKVSETSVSMQPRLLVNSLPILLRLWFRVLGLANLQEALLVRLQKDKLGKKLPRRDLLAKLQLNLNYSD